MNISILNASYDSTKTTVIRAIADAQVTAPVKSKVALMEKAIAID